MTFVRLVFLALLALVILIPSGSGLGLAIVGAILTVLITDGLIGWRYSGPDGFLLGLEYAAYLRERIALGIVRALCSGAGWYLYRGSGPRLTIEGPFSSYKPIEGMVNTAASMVGGSTTTNAFGKFHWRAPDGAEPVHPSRDYFMIGFFD